MIRIKLLLILFSFCPFRHKFWQTEMEK